MQELINKAILASVAARREWDLKPVQDRAQILFKAADVISGPKRAEILAKTMIGQVHVFSLPVCTGTRVLNLETLLEYEERLYRPLIKLNKNISHMLTRKLWT